MSTDSLIVYERESTAAKAVERLRGMFLDVPGTRLSIADAARLSGVEPSLCRRVLETLMDSYFLKRGPDGTFTIR
jgi:DNA-binding IclR family transcriptional regulator